MEAPQSHEDVRPIIEALQRLDGLLDIRWEPKAWVTDKGAYSVTGKLTPPQYAGRWQVIRYQTPNLHAERDYSVICTLTTLTEHGGIKCLTDRGGYMPVGEWLIEFMHSADAANVRHMTELRKRLWAQDDALDTQHEAAEEAMARESLDHVHFHAAYAGGVGNWQGRGADFAASPD